MTRIYCKCEGVEIRGIEQKTSKKGNSYFILNCENSNGTPFSVYVPNNVNILDLKKGDIVDLECIFTTGKYPKFDLVGVIKYEY